LPPALADVTSHLLRQRCCAATLLNFYTALLRTHYRTFSLYRSSARAPDCYANRIRAVWGCTSRMLHGETRWTGKTLAGSPLTASSLPLSSSLAFSVENEHFMLSRHYRAPRATTTTCHMAAYPSAACLPALPPAPPPHTLLQRLALHTLHTCGVWGRYCIEQTYTVGMHTIRDDSAVPEPRSSCHLYTHYCRICAL